MLNVETVNLASALRRYPRSPVCLVGGGGKTTLLHALGKALAAGGERVLCTTSTRMAEPGPETGMPVHLADDPLQLRLPPEGLLLAARPGEGGKVFGYTPEELDDLDRRGVADWILVEADGAARRPLKAPAGHEPVIPSRTVASIAVVGLSGVVQPFSPERVFRFDRASAITGLRDGDAFTPETVAALVTHPNGLFQYTPPDAARLVFLNQADTPELVDVGLAIADACQAGVDGAYVGSLHATELDCRAAGPAPVRIHGLVLAAGGDTRLGGGKLLLPWRGRPVLAHTLAAVLASGVIDGPTLVLGHGAAAVEEAVTREFPNNTAISLLVNSDWSEGQSTSLRAGVRHIRECRPEAAAVMVVLGDQPLITPATLRRLAMAHRRAVGADPSHPVTAPRYRGRRGNPVILSSKLFDAVESIQGDRGARGILAELGDRVLLVDVDDPGVVGDIDTPEAYQALRHS
ncbi:MAG: putative selenium-dependent hydroxylase accessory protein YqeC [Planctomycetaceae bacterium]|nr:putative selenium-dependent hydroxylase accessory protein YqeC [Planctomycetaceae bacterium]